MLHTIHSSLRCIPLSFFCLEEHVAKRDFWLWSATKTTFLGSIGWRMQSNRRCSTMVGFNTCIDTFPSNLVHSFLLPLLLSFVLIVRIDFVLICTAFIQDGTYWFVCVTVCTWSWSMPCVCVQCWDSVCQATGSGLLIPVRTVSRLRSKVELYTYIYNTHDKSCELPRIENLSHFLICFFDTYQAYVASLWNLWINFFPGLTQLKNILLLISITVSGICCISLKLFY